MSSYYDEMARRVQRALDQEGQEAAERVVSAVKDGLRRYLDYAEAHVWKAEQGRFVEFKANILRLLEGPNSEGTLGPGMVIQELHSIGHDLGMKFHLRGAVRMTSDNPYWPGNWGIDEGLEYASLGTTELGRRGPRK